MKSDYKREINYAPFNVKLRRQMSRAEDELYNTAQLFACRSIAVVLHLQWIGERRDEWTHGAQSEALVMAALAWVT